MLVTQYTIVLLRRLDDTVFTNWHFRRFGIYRYYMFVSYAICSDAWSTERISSLNAMSQYTRVFSRTLFPRYDLEKLEII